MVVTIGAVVVAGLGYKALTRRFGGDDSALETVGRFEI
jgi:hypothetical protein